MNSKTRPFRLTRVAVLALFSLVLLFGTISTFTYALYHNEINENTAKIQAGDLEVSAKYVKLEGTKIDTDATSATHGRLVNISENKDVVLTEAVESIFNISRAVPTMYQTATFEVKNDGGIAYDIEVRICDLVLDSAADTALSQQMNIIVECDGVSKEFRLNTFEAADSCLKIESVLPDVTKTIKVTATFLDDTPFNTDSDPANDFDNMETTGADIDFDITFIVVQDTTVAP